MNEKNKPAVYFYAVIIAGIISIFAEYYIMRVESIIDHISIRAVASIFSDVRLLYIFITVSIIALLYAHLGSKLLNIIFQYRYFIALVLFILCIVFEISGSSIGMWAEYLGIEDGGVLIGKSRPIRSDEWAVSTPFMISQYKNYPETFSYFSNTVRGTMTDIFLEYGQAAKNLLMIYRPFYLGYLILPIAKGMAFFWCGRYIALFLVSFEFGRYMTRDRRGLSVVYAFMLTLAPTVQWWFAINGLVEMLIFAQLSILMLYQFMTKEDKIVRILCAAVIVICAGGYILTFYPGWQVPGAYVILGLIIWTVWEHYEECSMSRQDWIIIAVSSVFLLASMLYLLYQSGETIQALLNTEYPGNRTETGGGMGALLGNYLTNFWYATTENFTYKNVCNSAEIIDFFPLGLILLIHNAFRKRKLEHFSAILLILWCFFGVYCLIGFPTVLAKLTLMSFSLASRVRIWFGIVNLLMLIYELSRLGKIQVSISVKNVISLAFALGISGLAIGLNRQYFSAGKAVIIILLSYAVCKGALDYADRKIAIIWNSCMIFVMLIAGVLINPVRSGIDFLENSEYINQIEGVVESDPSGKWVAAGMNFPMQNSLIMAGAPTVNSTNIYPNLELWEMLDPDGTYSEIYNRYAHITINLKPEGLPEFELLFDDQFAVSLTVQDLKKIGITYVLCNSSQDSYTLSGELSLISDANCYIYRIN